MQSYDELNDAYKNPDPWGYQTNDEDLVRKAKILSWINTQSFGRRFNKALDVGCGEAWITKDLPADEIYGFELSENAKNRWPENVKDISRRPTVPSDMGSIDLVLCTGALYSEYHWQTMVGKIIFHASDFIVTCNIKDREVPEAIAAISEVAMVIATHDFPYREWRQILRVWRMK